MYPILIAFIAGLIGGIIAHVTVTFGLIKIFELRAIRAKNEAVAIWHKERAVLKDEFQRTRIRMAALEKKLTGKTARIK